MTKSEELYIINDSIMDGINELDRSIDWNNVKQEKNK